MTRIALPESERGVEAGYSSQEFAALIKVLADPSEAGIGSMVAIAASYRSWRT